MDNLSALLHRLIDHAVPPGNEHGELHSLADRLAPPLAGTEPAPKSDGAGEA